VPIELSEFGWVYVLRCQSYGGMSITNLNTSKRELIFGGWDDFQEVAKVIREEDVARFWEEC